jgi:Lysylphosphatidylglycerol synthase TM region
MRRSLGALLAVSITVACLWFFLTPSVLASLGRLGVEASWSRIIAAFALTGAVQWLRAWRFAVLTSGRPALPEAPMIRIALQLNFLNFVLPFRLGELGYPALMRQQYGEPLLRSAGVLLIARLFDLATVAAILAGAAALYAGSPFARAGLAFAALALAAAPLALVLLGDRLWLRLVRYLGRKRRTALPLAGLTALNGPPARLVVALGFAIWLVFGLAAVLAASAVVASVPPGAAMLGAAAGNLAFALPVNGIAGLGPAQAAWVLATIWAGVPGDAAVVSALALHAVVLLNALILGGLASAGILGRRCQQSLSSQP